MVLRNPFPKDFHDFLLNLRIVKKTHQRLFNGLMQFGLLDLVPDFGAIHFAPFLTTRQQGRQCRVVPKPWFGNMPLRPGFCWMWSACSLGNGE